MSQYMWSAWRSAHHKATLMLTITPPPPVTSTVPSTTAFARISFAFYFPLRCEYRLAQLKEVFWNLTIVLFLKLI